MNLLVFVKWRILVWMVVNVKSCEVSLVSGWLGVFFIDFNMFVVVLIVCIVGNLFFGVWVSVFVVIVVGLVVVILVLIVWVKIFDICCCIWCVVLIVFCCLIGWSILIINGVVIVLIGSFLILGKMFFCNVLSISVECCVD